MTASGATRFLIGLTVLTASAFAQQSVERAAATSIEGGAPPPPLKVPLSGKALKKYNQARATALTYLAAKSCSAFLGAHGFDPQSIAKALGTQQPEDGSTSTISFAAAGIVGSQPDPHAGDSIQTVFRNPAFLTMAVSQPNGNETYYNPLLLTRKIAYPYSNPVSLIHEALHNLTGESDVAIAQELGFDGFEPLAANIFLNDSLKKYCDSTR